MNQTEYYKEKVKQQPKNKTMIFESINNKKVEEISSNIWNKKYRFENETPEEFYLRITKGIFYKNSIYELMWNLMRQYKDLIHEYNLITIDSNISLYHYFKDYDWDYLIINFEEDTSDINSLKNLIEHIAFNIIANQYFIPAGRIEYALGTPRSNITLSNCFVMPEVKDSMNGIMDILKEAAITMKAGGGVGYYFGKLRPKNSKTITTYGYASGPVSFMKIFNTMCQTIESAGGRRGAQIAILPIWHPDILEFVTSKKGLTNNELTNFNISVSITDKFMEILKNDGDWELIFPNFEEYKDLYESYWNSDECHSIEDWINKVESNNKNEISQNIIANIKEFPSPIKVYKTLKAKEIWETIMKNAYKYSEPGVLFIDNVNNYSPLSYTEYINATNPCIIGSTKILLADGSNIPIKDLVDKEIKILALALPEEKLNIKKKYTKKLIKNAKSIVLTAKNIRKTRSNAELLLIETTKGEPLICTPDHRILTIKRGYVQAKDLTLKDKLYTYNSSNHKLDIKNIKKLDYREDVYDMEVEDYHNFIANGIVIHNCGEQPLPSYGSCNLAHINYVKLVKEPFKECNNYEEILENIDFKLLEFLTSFGVIYLDTILDINYFPLEKQKEYVENFRVIGEGFTGLGDFFAMLKVKYGSKISQDLSELLGKSLALNTFLQSLEIAKYFGSYKKFDYNGYTTTNYFKELINPLLEEFFPLFNAIKNFDYSSPIYPYRKDIPKTFENLIDDLAKYGIRNGRLMTVAPTGTTSLLCNNISSGIEPIFNLEIKRNIIVDSINKITKKLYLTDYAYEYFKSLPENKNLTYEEASKLYYFTPTMKLSINDHIMIQSIFQKYIDGSISKTINIPEKYPYNKFKSVYINAHKNKLKGITIFRENEEMIGILSSNKENSNDHKPKIIPDQCPSIRFKAIGSNGEKIYLNITYDEDTGNPLELFTTIPKKSGEINNKFFPKLYFEKKALWDVISRLISLLLRTDVSIEEIHKQIEKSSYTLDDSPSILSNILKNFMNFKNMRYNNNKKKKISKKYYKICPECNNGKMIVKDGCEICDNCNYSPCDK